MRILRGRRSADGKWEEAKSASPSVHAGGWERAWRKAQTVSGRVTLDICGGSSVSDGAGYPATPRA